jgi:hypothetical protein
LLPGLAGNAPEAFTELLAYDCRLMNTATANGKALELRDWLTLNRKELQWLERIEREFDALPADEAVLLEQMRVQHAGVFDPTSYALA